MNVLISINPRYLSDILRGEKKIELRKTPPAQPDESVKYYCYETGGKKAVTAVFYSSGCRKVVFEGGLPENDESVHSIAKDACVSVDELKKYLGKSNTLYLIQVDRAEPIDPKSLSDFVSRDDNPVTTPPQSWMYCKAIR